MNKIRINDIIEVITGKDKGKKGKVLGILKNNKVIVEDVNKVVKHQKPNPNQGISGGITTKNMPIDVSNVLLFNPQTGKGDRIGFRILADGRKARYFKSTNELIDV